MVLNKLNKQSIAKLCSDQVVLDLSSIIKELTENALDAGASHIGKQFTFISI
jgi:DNA mismatch repair ATPase MutL